MAGGDGNGDVALTDRDEGQPTGAQPSFGEVLAETRGALERFARMRTQAEQVSVTETSADGHVTVTVNSGGVPTDLRISEQAASMTCAQIAAAVMATMRKAQARLADRVGEVMQATMGDDKETVDRVLAVYHDRFPEPEPDEPQYSEPDTEMRFGEPADELPTPAPRRQQPTTDDDDWDSGGSFMRHS